VCGERIAMNEHIIKLPAIIDCDDYHELSYIESFFHKLNKDIKIKEVGFDDSIRKYIGIAYISPISSDDYDKLMRINNGV